MRTTPADKIRDYRARGWWGDTRIHDMFDANAGAQPDRLAIIDAPNRADLVGTTSQRLTFAAVAALIDGYSLSFTRLGLGKDDVLITQLPNIAEYPAIYVAAMRLGIVVSPVPMQFRRHELEQIVRLTTAKAILTIDQLKGADQIGIALSLSTDLGKEGISLQVLSLRSATATTRAPDGAIAFEAAPLDPVSTQELRTAVAAADVNADDIATICWTSGTEGMPKGVPRSHNHWYAISFAHLRGAGIQPGEVLLNPFPLINMAAIGGCFMSWMHNGGTLVLHHPLDLPTYLKQIAIERPQYAIAPPALLNMLLKNEALLATVDLSSLRCIGSGSAPLDPEMIAGYHERFGIEICNNFGSNEGVSLISNAENAADPVHRARWFPRFGRDEVRWDPPPPVHIRTRIIDPDTGEEILTAGKPGELQITGPTVFDGYYRAPEVTAQSFTADGWFRTGDLFELCGDADDLRFYRFVGRLKQIIIRGGVKIAPEELDNLLSQMPSVLEGAVASYADPIMGEKICAVVVPKPDAEITLESICQQFRAAGLAMFKFPERVRIVTQLPRNSVGKVLRGELTRIAESPDDR
ncbi:MAG: class I adenylate-forming enzyme family protein [Steroidobacteraceae bacterium]